MIDAAAKEKKMENLKINEMQGIIAKAETLIEALPYIQSLSGKTVVIKYGGNAMINDELKNHVMADITLLKFIGKIGRAHV